MPTAKPQVIPTDPTTANTDRDSWTYGAEHELADWDASREALYDLVSEGFQRSPDYTIVNSSGIAVQPTTKHHRFGGEINTPPTSTIREQGELLNEFVTAAKVVGPAPTVNYRSNLHVHIRVPGLAGDLTALKRVQAAIHSDLWLEYLQDLIPLPVPEESESGQDPYQRTRNKRCRVSHHTLLNSERLERQMLSLTLPEFYEAEVPKNRSGNPMWHAQARCAINLRQLLQTDTVEFRCFPGTLEPDLVINCLRWAADFLYQAINFRGGSMFNPKFTPFRNRRRWWPQFEPVNCHLETCYRATCHNGKFSLRQRLHNMRLIEEDNFYGTPEYDAARRQARGDMSR